MVFLPPRPGTGTVQSNVSAHISRLEADLGVALIDRHSGDLTEEGARVVERARRVVHELEDIAADVHSTDMVIEGETRLGCIGTTARWLMPRLLSALGNAHPRVHATVYEGATSLLIPRLLSGDLDGAIIHFPVDHPELVLETLFAEDLVLLVHNNFEWASRESVSITELAQRPILLPPRTNALRRILDRVAASHRVALQPLVEIDGMRLLASLAFEGFGPAVVPATAIPTWLRGDFARVSIPELPRRTVGWATAIDRFESTDTGNTRGRQVRIGKGDHSHQGSIHTLRQPRHHGLILGVSTTTNSAGSPTRSQRRGISRHSLAENSHRSVMWIDVDSSHRRGALSRRSEVIAHAATAARNQGIPLVMSLGSSGADIVEGVAALHGWGQAARAIADCSGVVPTITIVNGPAVSGPALLIGLSDFVIMTADSYAFVTGPTMVAEFTGVGISNDELGGTDAHARQSGVASLVVSDDIAALGALEHLLMYLPNIVDELALNVESNDQVDRLTPQAGQALPDSASGSYDIRKVIRALADDSEMFELRDRWAPNVITAFITIGGEAVGVVANQPMSLAGTLDISASQKAARFVSFCDSFNIPLLTLVDTPGFYPGKDLEWRGMIRHGGQSCSPMPEPRFLEVRDTAQELWRSLHRQRIQDDGQRPCQRTTAELAVMGAGQAAAILQRRATAKERAAFESDYSERLLNLYIAAERGYIDAVIDPADTRREIAAHSSCCVKTERLMSRKHDNTPL